MAEPPGGGQGRAWDGAGALRPDLGQPPTTAPRGLWDLAPHCQAPGEGCQGRSVSEGGWPEPGRGRTGSTGARAALGGQLRTAIKLVRPRPCPVLKDMEQSQPEPRGGTGNGPTLQAGTA